MQSRLPTMAGGALLRCSCVGDAWSRCRQSQTLLAWVDAARTFVGLCVVAVVLLEGWLVKQSVRLMRCRCKGAVHLRMSPAQDLADRMVNLVLPSLHGNGAVPRGKGGIKMSRPNFSRPYVSLIFA
jgi:hypothetical protein